jgi:hypothetical protein
VTLSPLEIENIGRNVRHSQVYPGGMVSIDSGCIGEVVIFCCGRNPGYSCIFLDISTTEIFAHAVIVPVCKQGDKTDCSNYLGISLLSTSYNILSIVISYVNCACTLNLWGSSVLILM